jgi:hypothetical protein
MLQLRAYYYRDDMSIFTKLLDSITNMPSPKEMIDSFSVKLEFS